MQSTCVQSGSVWQDVVIELAQYYEDGEEEFPEAEAPTVASPSSVQLPPSGQEDVVTQTVTKSLTEFPEERRSALGLRPGRRFEEKTRGCRVAALNASSHRMI